MSDILLPYLEHIVYVGRLVNQIWGFYTSIGTLVPNNYKYG